MTDYLTLYDKETGKKYHLFVVNKKTQKRYQVVKLDNEAGTITLKGQHEPFTEPYDKEWLEKQGYHRVKEEVVETTA